MIIHFLFENPDGWMGWLCNKKADACFKNTTEDVKKVSCIKCKKIIKKNKKWWASHGFI